MNERIKELAEQAGFQVSEVFGPMSGPYPIKEPLEKFAELIVEECIKSALSLQDIAIKAQWGTEETFHMIVDTIAEDLNMLHIFRS